MTDISPISPFPLSSPSFAARSSLPVGRLSPMILRLAHFLSLLGLSLALSCNQLKNNEFRCRGKPASDTMIEKCKMENKFVVCMYQFKESTMTLRLDGPTDISDETSNQCMHHTSSDDFFVYCTTDDCEIDIYDVASKCREELMICGEQKLISTKDQYCFILIQPQNKIFAAQNPTKVSTWTRDISAASLPKSGHYETCFADVGYGAKRFCDSCDTFGRKVKPIERHLRDCFPGQTIQCNGEVYVVAMKNMRKSGDRETEIKAACAVDIRIENGTTMYNSSFQESADPNNCTSVNMVTQSISLLCGSDDCDQELKSSRNLEEALDGKCNVEIFHCGDNKHFFLRSAGFRYCVSQISSKDGNSSSEYRFVIFPSRLAPGCHVEQNEFYCEKDCNNRTMMDGKDNCLIEEIAKEVEEDNSQTRLLLSIFMPIITLLFVVPIVAGGFCALYNARAAFAYEEEKYLTEFGMSFEEDTPEVEEVTKKTKKSGLSTGKTGGKTSKNGQSTPTHKTTTKTISTVKTGKTRTTTTGKSGKTSSTVNAGTTVTAKTTSNNKADKQSTPS